MSEWVWSGGKAGKSSSCSRILDYIVWRMCDFPLSSIPLPRMCVTVVIPIYVLLAKFFTLNQTERFSYSQGCLIIKTAKAQGRSEWIWSFRNVKILHLKCESIISKRNSLFCYCFLLTCLCSKKCVLDNIISITNHNQNTTATWFLLIFLYLLLLLLSNS